jgi:hypothetical protein
MKHNKETEKVKNIWDKKSTIFLILTVLILSSVSFGIYFIPGYLRDRKANELNGRTTGIVVKMVPKSIFKQGFYGRRESTYSYEVTFVYTVNSKTFTNTNNLSAYGKYYELISSIRKSNFTKKIDINFNEKNPEESMIRLE